MAVKIRVAKEDGSPITMDAAVRTILRIIVAFFLLDWGDTGLVI